MRHHTRTRRLNRTGSERKALFRALASAIVRSQRITTTAPKAKEARRVIERLITLAKKGDVSSQRRIFEVLQDRSLVKELVHNIAPLFKNRVGGYTRIIRVSKFRKGDNAELVILELTEQKAIVLPTKKAKKEKAAEAKKDAAAAKADKEAGQEKPSESKKEEQPKHMPKEERKHTHVEKPKRGFFQNFKRFIKPKTTGGV
ncbi:MAG: 50S ribosomal protein L17 [Candidatus Omnitrophica bacterium]|nr:50S ribosomal protein L17 [Candidatus Omnitrophota bacterium]